MKDQRALRITVTALTAGILVVLLLCLLASFVWIRVRTTLREQRPLVMIHSPAAEQEFAAGEAVILHATARVSGRTALDRIDLWVDGTHQGEQVAADAQSQLLVLHEAWSPEASGTHSIVVTAQSRSGTKGQASLEIEVLPTETEQAAGAVGAIAREEVAGAEEDEPESHGPPAPGGAGGGGEEPARPPDEAAPPGSARDFFSRIGWSSMRALPSSESPTAVSLEILELTTTRAFEGLHCYIGLAGAPPRWYPDEDGDQTTDESFASLGAGIWEVATHFSGDRALNLPWGSADALAIEATCVGLAGGGMVAVEAGHMALSIPMELWDGIARMETSEPREGRFRIVYRVTPLYGEPPGHRIELDPDMIPPTDLRIVGYSLHWRYPEGEEIDGFRIFLNGALQWTEPAGARESYLPYEWLYPPCGETYQFYVDAYVGEDWSPPSNTITLEGGTPGSEGCQRTYIIEFQSLETFDIPNDEDHRGWIGPVYGSFYVNDQEIRFSSACEGGGYSDFCDYMGFEDSSTYDIRRLTSNWGPGPARFIVSAGMEEGIVVGFDIQDQDWAPWNDDDAVCAGDETVQPDSLSRASTQTVSSDFFEVEGCRVTLTINPTLDSPATDFAGRPPRPQLAVADLSVDEATGQLEIHVINGGYATWAGRDLDVVVRWPSGELIGQYTFPELVLRPGDTTILKHPDLVPSPHPALGACVLLDPGNQVLEEEDYSPDVYIRGEYCRRLPDLTITDVEMDEAEERLLVTVRNGDEGSVEDSTIGLAIQLPDGRTIVPERAWEHVSIAPYRSSLFIWDGLTDSIRGLLGAGFTITVDPENEIAESDGTNNSYVMPAGGMYRITWTTVLAPYYEFVDGYGWHYNDDRFWTGVFAETGSTARLLADWEAPEGGGICRVRRGQYMIYRYCLSTNPRVEVELEGDETVVFYAGGRLHVGPYQDTGLGACLYNCDHSLGEGVIRVGPDEWTEAPVCSDYGPSLELSTGGFPTGLIGDHSWSTHYRMCRVE